MTRLDARIRLAHGKERLLVHARLAHVARVHPELRHDLDLRPAVDAPREAHADVGLPLGDLVLPGVREVAQHDVRHARREALDDHGAQLRHLLGHDVAAVDLRVPADAHVHHGEDAGEHARVLVDDRASG